MTLVAFSTFAMKDLIRVLSSTLVFMVQSLEEQFLNISDIVSGFIASGSNRDFIPLPMIASLKFAC